MSTSFQLDVRSTIWIRCFMRLFSDCAFHQRVSAGGSSLAGLHRTGMFARPMAFCADCTDWVGKAFPRLTSILLAHLALSSFSKGAVLIEMAHVIASQLVLVDESTANGRSADRKAGWSPVGKKARTLQPFHRL